MRSSWSERYWGRANLGFEGIGDDEYRGAEYSGGVADSVLRGVGHFLPPKSEKTQFFP